MFLTAVPIAGVAFILSWFLREVPLRTTSSVGIGEGLGATPPARTSSCIERSPDHIPLPESAAATLRNSSLTSSNSDHEHMYVRS